MQVAKSTSDGDSSIDPATRFLYTPRTISALFLGLAAVVYYARVLDPEFTSPDPQVAAAQWSANVELGVKAAICVYLGYSAVQGPRTSMIRPHPTVWRLVHGMLVVYVLFLVWLLFQNLDDARIFLKHLSPGLGKPVVYRSYAADCRLYTPEEGVRWGTLKDTVWDIFVVAHTLGWWAKALILRNRLMLWSISILFELMERTFAHMLPNFRECWWDSWVLDVAVCNAAGIGLGMWTVRAFECKYEAYNWQGISQLRGLTAKARRSVAQLLPYSWQKFDWMVFSSPHRFLQSSIVVVMFLMFEVNVFFLKYALWIPPENPLNTYRLLIWFAVGLPAVREYYEFLENSRAAEQQQQQAVAAAGEAAKGAVEGVVGESKPFNRLGVFAWLALAMTCLETMISVKFGKGLYPAPWPLRVLLFWGTVLGSLALWLCAWQLRIWRRQRRARSAVLQKQE